MEAAAERQQFGGALAIVDGAKCDCESCEFESNEGGCLDLWDGAFPELQLCWQQRILWRFGRRF
jgi:hypothetical protein